MKRGFTAVLMLLMVLSISGVPVISADSVEDEFKKIANYAGEYETGNIDYVKLLIYSSAVREKMNEILGVTSRENGGILKQEQIKSILGESYEETKWAWSEGAQKEIKLENAVPVWKKIIFDGKKIQIRLNAWPSVFSRNKMNEKSSPDSEKNKAFDDLEGKLVYRLNFEIEFKKSGEQMDIQGKINDIQALAQAFNSDPSSGNAEALAKESVNAEKAFESYFKQKAEKCEDVMAGIFGTENKRQTQQMQVQEVSFCEGDNYEVIARMEMCDDCEWNWINLNFNFQGRGPGFKMEESKMDFASPKNFESMSSSAIEEEIRRTIENNKQSCDSGDFNSIMKSQSSLMALNEALNKKSNDVWKEVDEEFKSKTESMTQEERMKFDQNFGWIKQEQEKRQKVKELSKANYELRKQFYMNIFANYEKKEYYFTQIEFQKRLVEEFQKNGEEICDNNIDDNKNNAIDCADEQCGGKICGKGKNSIQEGNETNETEVDFYCIEKECKPREEVQKVVFNMTNETKICPELPSVECAEGGKAFFSKYDNETNCPIETSCLEKNNSCSADEECGQPACGIAKCIESKCEVTELTECKESECVGGDKKICESDGNIVELCVEGFWETTGNCSEAPEIMEEIIVGNECLSASDCGNNNICANGVCQVLPQVVITEPIIEEEQVQVTESDSEEQEKDKEESQEEQKEEEYKEETQEEQGGALEENENKEESQTESSGNSESSGSSESSGAPETSAEPASESGEEITGGIIFNFINTLFSEVKILGAVITGFEVEGGGEDSSSGGSDGGGSGGGDSGGGSSDGGSSEGGSSDSGSGDSGDGGSSDGGLSGGEGGDITPGAEGGQPTEGPQIQQEERRDENNENQNEDGEREDNRRREDDRRKDEDAKRQEENKERCKTECKRPCIEKCIKEACGEELECVVEETQKKCEETCEATEDCIGKCMKGGDWWKEFQNKDENKNQQEKGVFQVGGSCRTNQGKTEGFIWFGGWGEPFEQIQNLKQKYYSGGQADWCKSDFENLKKQREEFEKGFNQGFVQWFFENYLANSAENWEQSVSGIFELYWKDVDNAREMAYRMQCLGISELPSVNLVNVKYETEYGSVEFWEEMRTTRLGGMDKEVQVITPYMKAWVFPSKEFITYQLKKAMKNHEFPGSPEKKMERKNEEGPTAEEREKIKQDKGFMEMIKDISGKYNGNLDAVIRFVDNGAVIFNLYVQVNENDIIKVVPMLPEEVPAEDVRVEIEFQKLYDIIYAQEKEMGGQRTESPPWGAKIQPVQKVKDVVNNVKMYFKMKDMLNSAAITPESSASDVKSLMKSFFSMMNSKKSGSQGPQEGKDEEKAGKMGEEKGVWEEKGKITGEVIAG